MAPKTLCGVLLGLSVSTFARAEPPGLTPTPEPPEASPVKTELLPSYHLETGLVDLATLGFGLATAKSGAGAIAISSYLLGGPIVHLVNHHVGRAGASLALRVGLPIAGVFLGGALGSSRCNQACTEDDDLGYALVGLFAGVVAASAIDIGYLSRGETVTHSSADFGVTVSTGPNNAVRLGLGGRF